MTPTVHFMYGLPGSGKTQRALELVRASDGRMHRVALDELRAMAYGPSAGFVSGEREEAVLAIQDAAVATAVRAGRDIVLDNTHLLPAIPNRVTQLVGGLAVFAVHDLTGVPLAECIRRDAERPRPVGEEVIRTMARRLKSVRASGYRLTAERLNDTPVWHVRPYLPDPAKPFAVVGDIDGTAALRGDRGPYDFHRLHLDTPNAAVIYTLACYRAQGDVIVLLTGRDEEFREATVRWLVRHNVPFDELHMRPHGDTRPDDVVKAELFDRYVRDRFQVRLSLDDRDRVVRLWRHGFELPCFQVNYGAF